MSQMVKGHVAFILKKIRSIYSIAHIKRERDMATEDLTSVDRATGAQAGDWAAAC